jgi:hypothetical protein
MHRMKCFLISFCIFAIILQSSSLADEGLFGCSFQTNPDEFLAAQSRVRRNVYDRTNKLTQARYAAGRQENVQPSDIPRRNFIDDRIFGKLSAAGVQSARLTTDEEFIRRIYLDLTGRIPTADQVRSFVADTDTGKRTAVIDKLLYSPEFVDKWTMWFGDLLQNNVQLSTSDFSRQFDGRNAFWRWIKTSVAEGRSIHDMAWTLISSNGSNFATDTGMVNYIAGMQTSMGPRQDTLDMAMVRTATTFLGLGYYDCLACHAGRGHLDSNGAKLSLWGQRTTRVDAWRMSAFFARTSWTRDSANAATRQYTDPNFNQLIIGDLANGTYDANVTFGNRPAHCADGLPPDARTGRCLATKSYTPEYRDTHATPARDQNWRSAFANFVTEDPMFSRNFANRLWKQFFNLALVDPVDTLDPDRLDPKVALPEGWTYQATHPELLQELADAFSNTGTNLREFIRIIVSSSAYQLSSRYDGDWKVEYVPLFARHYPRRLDAEEIHDAIVQATQVLPKYTVQASGNRSSSTAAAPMLDETFTWAMSLPDTSEPRNNGAATFMNTFLRGNRDTQQRSQAGSIVQQLAIMNDNFVTSRTRIAASPALANIAKLTDNDAVVTEIFLTFLSRLPSEGERTTALKPLTAAANANARNTAVEDLAWAAINKVDFLFSY